MEGPVNCRHLFPLSLLAAAMSLTLGGFSACMQDNGQMYTPRFVQVRISGLAHTIVALGVAYEETFTRYDVLMLPRLIFRVANLGTMAP